MPSSPKGNLPSVPTKPGTASNGTSPRTHPRRLVEVKSETALPLLPKVLVPKRTWRILLMGARKCHALHCLNAVYRLIHHKTNTTLESASKPAKCLKQKTSFYLGFDKIRELTRCDFSSRKSPLLQFYRKFFTFAVSTPFCKEFSAFASRSYSASIRHKLQQNT